MVAGRAVPWLRLLVDVLSPQRPWFAPGSIYMDLWWEKWYWDMFFPEFFGFPLSTSFHHRSPNHLGDEQYVH
jgi:hypothetical protein